MSKLKTPEQYRDDVIRLAARCRYYSRQVLRIKKRTNRHTNCDGTLWGWYELFPLDKTVGYWSEEGGHSSSDLSQEDINAWNKRAAIFVEDTLNEIGYKW